MKIFSQTKLINLLLLMGMIILIVCGIIAYRQVQRLVEANKWVIHTHKVIEAANTTLLSLTEAESQLNYYEFTHDKSSIQDLPKLIDVTQQKIRLLKYLVQDNVIQEIRVHDLEALANTKIALTQQISQMGDSQAGLQLAESQKRAETKADFTRKVADITQEEENLLAQRNAIVLHEATISNSMFIIFVVLSESFILLSLILLNHNLHQRNIAEQKQTEAENELRASETYKTAILEAASDSIITIDEQKNIMSFNPQTIKEFHYFSEELLNKNIEVILPSFDLNLAKLPYKSDIEVLGVRKNGENFPVEIKVSRMDIDKKNMSVIIVRDITERKKIEKIKNEFVSVVSHELRTPLTSIRGALGLVLGGAAGTFPEKIKKLLDLANNNCERLLLLISDILDMEKIEAGKMNFVFKVIDINQLVSEAIAANQMFAEKYGVRLTLAQSEPNLDLNVDPDRLMQVLANLISNAIKFSPKGEEVTLAIKQRQESVRVLISNKGAGIPNDFQLHIFQKFSQVDTSDTRGKGGTGLGLNISKAIIEKLGGTLNFISKPGEITTFYFDLPLWQTTQEIIEAQKSKSPSHSQDRILICEDDEDQASYLSQLLESAGFQIDMAYTVNEAKNLLSKNTYHVLLLDLILPDQDGISFIRELRSKEQTSTLPIIVLSVIAQTGRSLLNGNAFAIVDWLDKPIDFDKLLQAMQHIKKKTYPAIPNILHVEDDVETFEVVQTLLGKDANVISATTIQETVEKLNHLKIDLVILDLLLPDGNAEQFLPLISKYELPIIVYSANELDKNLAQLVKYVLVKSKTSNEQLISLVKHVLETST